MVDSKPLVQRARPNRVLTPPTEGVEEFRLRRDPFDDEVMLYIPTKGRVGEESSYLMEFQPLRSWMQVVMFDRDKVDLILDYLWNFRNCEVSTTRGIVATER